MTLQRTTDWHRERRRRPRGLSLIHRLFQTLLLLLPKRPKFSFSSYSCSSRLFTSLSLSLHISLYILTNFLTLCYMMPFVGARPYRYILRSLHMFISLCTLLMFAYLYDCVTLFLLELRLTVSYTCSLPLFCTSLSFFLSFFLYLPIFLHLLLHFFPSSHFSLSLFSTSCLPICPSKFVPYKS